MPTVRCVLVQPSQYSAGVSSGSAGFGCSTPAGTPGPKWVGAASPLWVRTKQVAAALADTHKAWSTQSYQTLQRVGSIIRSTSMDCLAALGKKGTSAAGQQPSGQRPPGNNHDDQDEDSLVRASLSRFLTTADDAEVSQAARMSDLSNMAYDVLDVTSARLQEAHGLTLITHSRSSAAPQRSQSPTLQEQLQQLQDSAEQQHPHLLQQLPLPQAPRPVPLVLLQPAGSAPMPSTEYSGLPASPRTPAVMSSYSEEDHVYGAAVAAEYHPVTASGYFTDPGSPRRPSAAAAAAAAAAGGGVAVASMGMPAAPAMGEVPPAYMQPLLSRQHSAEFGPQFGVQYPQHPDEAGLSMDEAALLQQLKQQEAFILLEMQASQQMMLLLQQSQQHLHLQEQQDATPAQDLHQLQEIAASASSITAAASTAAAAALAGSSMFEAPGAASPRSSSDGSGILDAAAAAGVAGAPSDWFCCDGPLSESDATPTRFFAIQGSITLDHWRINLSIDPVEFEAGVLGPIRVHRGMYEAALSMYDMLLPLVQQHLAAHPEGKIALTGHSLGGSLATLLMLLMVHR